VATRLAASGLAFLEGLPKLLRAMTYLLFLFGWSVGILVLIGHLGWFFSCSSKTNVSDPQKHDD
jgi:hypothetical protein